VEENKMMEVGRVCVKLAGRDAGKKCVIIGILEGNIVMIDGETRRRKCNIKHLEPLKQTISIKDNASHEEVAKAFKELGVELKETKPKEKTEKPKKVKASKKEAAPKEETKKEKKAKAKEEKAEKKEAKKEAAKKEAKEKKAKKEK
jgi:large subunit ribosomal protein L14e